MRDGGGATAGGALLDRARDESHWIRRAVAGQGDDDDDDDDEWRESEAVRPAAARPPPPPPKAKPFATEHAAMRRATAMT